MEMVGQAEFGCWTFEFLPRIGFKISSQSVNESAGTASAVLASTKKYIWIIAARSNGPQEQTALIAKVVSYTLSDN